MRKKKGNTEFKEEKKKKSKCVSVEEREKKRQRKEDRQKYICVCCVLEKGNVKLLNKRRTRRKSGKKQNK